MIPFNQKILITGASGLVGMNLINRLKKEGFEVLGLDSKNDLRKASLTQKIFKNYKPKIVFHLAAKVGGIFANSNYKADFYSDNVLINTNVINACVRSNVEYVFAMGTGCAYPKRLENKILYEEALNIYNFRVPYKNKLIDISKNDSAWIESNKMIYMYFLANQDRLSCFFMLDYFNRRYLLDLIVAY